MRRLVVPGGWNEASTSKIGFKFSSLGRQERKNKEIAAALMRAARGRERAHGSRLWIERREPSQQQSWPATPHTVRPTDRGATRTPNTARTRESRWHGVSNRGCVACTGHAARWELRPTDHEGPYDPRAPSHASLAHVCAPAPVCHVALRRTRAGRLSLAAPSPRAAAPAPAPAPEHHRLQAGHLFALERRERRRCL